MKLEEYLEKYSPRIIIIECPSTPLFDCLQLDAEIFLLNDPIIPFEKYALQEIKKRVHFSEDCTDLIDQLKLFLNGKIKPKRNQEFYNHYVYKNNREKKIINDINQILKVS